MAFFPPNVLVSLLRKKAKINVFSLQMQADIWSSKLLALSTQYLLCFCL